MLELRDTFVSEINGQNVETDILQPGLSMHRVEPAEIVPGHAAQDFSFLLVNSSFGGSEGSAGACFDFDKAQRSVLPGDQIDITAQLRAAPAARYDNVSGASQVKVGSLFPPQTDVEMRWPFSPRQAASGPDESLEEPEALHFKQRHKHFGAGEVANPAHLPVDQRNWGESAAKCLLPLPAVILSDYMPAAET